MDKKKSETTQIQDDTTQINLENTQLGFENMGFLFVKDNDEKKNYPLKMGDNTVGRKSDSKPCDVMIDTNDMTMSRQHFNIYVQIGVRGSEYLLTDLSSAHGTYYSSDKVKSIKLGSKDTIYLSEGDTIKAGNTILTLETKKVSGTGKSLTGTIILE